MIRLWLISICIIYLFYGRIVSAASLDHVVADLLSQKSKSENAINRKLQGSPVCSPQIIQRRRFSEVFCTDPVQAICSKNPIPVELHDDYRSDIQLKVRQQIVRELSKEYGFDPPTFEEMEKQKNFDELQVKYLQRLREVIEAEFPVVYFYQLMKLELMDVLIKRGLVEFVSKVDSAKYESFDKSINNHFLFISWNYTKNFSRRCGKDGLRRSARLDPQSNEIMICPGLLLSPYQSDQETGVIDNWRNFLTLPVSHELGHTIHWSEGRDNYSELYQCLKVVHQIPEELHGRHAMMEITADYWGAEVMSATLERNQDWSSDQIETFVTNNLKAFCSYPERGGHLDGKKRIEIFGSFRPIRSALGCSEYSTSNTSECGL